MDNSKYEGWIDGSECMKNPSLYFELGPVSYRDTRNPNAIREYRYPNAITKIPIKAYLKTYDMQLFDEAIKRGQPRCAEGCCWDKIKFNDIISKRPVLTEVIIQKDAPFMYCGNDNSRLKLIYPHGSSTSCSNRVKVVKQTLIDDTEKTIDETVTNYWRSRYVTNETIYMHDALYLNKNDALQCDTPYWEGSSKY